jgi:hypothetical protein
LLQSTHPVTPLQGIVAGKLLSLGFTVAEEWGYIDRDTRKHRAIDVCAWRTLPRDEAHGISPTVDLVLECKRSRHPLVFFKKVADFGVPDFPAISGRRKVTISDYRTEGKRRVRPLRLANLLSARDLRFLREPPVVRQ